MSEPHPAQDQGHSQDQDHGRDHGPDHGHGAGDHPARRVKPAPLLFEPTEAVADDEHFFDLESIDDPRHLLARSTELVHAFTAAADRATEFQAIAAAQLADPKRFDRLTYAGIGERAGWSEDYAKRMVEFGISLMESNSDAHSPGELP